MSIKTRLRSPLSPTITGLRSPISGPVARGSVNIDHFIRTRQSTATPCVFVSEAGPWGYWLSRDLTPKG